MALRAAVWIEATSRATAAFAPLAVGRRPLRTAAQGRFDPFGAPFGNGRYLRIPAEDRSRRPIESSAGPRNTALCANATPVSVRSRREGDIVDRGGGRRIWADSAPTEVASGRTRVRTKAVIPLRARNRLHRPKRKTLPRIEAAFARIMSAHSSGIPPLRRPSYILSLLST
jgi:hypothetical protein